MKRLYLLLFSLFLVSNVFADDPIRGRLNITEEDGSPSVFPYQTRLPNGSLTDNGDGTASIAFTGSFAPSDAPYLTSTANGTLTNEVNLGALASGFLYGTVAGGTSTVSSVGTTGSGSVMLGTSPTVTTSLIMSDGATIGQVAGPLITFDDTANELEISGGNVGIGTTGPQYLLSVNGTSDFNNTTTWGNGGQGAITWGGSNFIVRGKSGIGLALGANDNNYVYITTSGNVGIGTTNPGYALQVNGSIAPTGHITSGQNLGDSSHYWYNTYTNALYAYNGGINGLIVSGNYFDVGSGNLRITSTGNVGIGTTGPGYKLDVANGNVRVQSSAGNGLIVANGTTDKWAWYLNNATNSLRLYDYVGLADSMTILTGGNVGIGTTSPTAVLHLKAGTATANTAPLKLTSGTLNTTAEAGAIEFLTDDYYATITTSAARKGIILNDGTALTSTKVPVASTNGRLIDSSFYSDASDNWWVGDGTGIPYGHMYTNTEGTVTVSVIDTWYEFDVATPDLTAGELNLVTFTDHYLAVTKAGRYLINWSASLKTSVAGQEIAATIGINGTASETGHGHSTVANANASVQLSGVTILDLAANDQVSLFVQNHSATTNITLAHAQVAVSMVGGT